ncbi:dickkopf-related protein 3 [Notechis scutatus]|uniref:Dickkopf-related protein 3 n=1 Tax=Notechis scutatus TaxID=8663 RepID=A0A6J1TYG3_9SAUR|nr:dickkopf-related protein 3 [Notechis scutatus]XP_026520624.1 dickkopf-related protein 3 [Notechis scutatus]
MFLLGLLFLPALLGMVFSAPASDSKKKEQPQEILLSFPKDETSLNEMLQEVEELMEDTQYKLTNAVREMEAEEGGSKKIMGIEFQKLPANYHNESYTDTKVGNKTIHRHQEIDKVTDNKTGSTSYSETIITSIQEDRKRNHECIIDEDCEIGKYCAFSDLAYHCHICKPQHGHCSRDVECCGEQLCVWGECMQAVSKGENGTICENQHDCNPGLCCAFTKDLLFPICNPFPGEREPCRNPSDELLNLITWELQPDGALDRCPCAHGLICQKQSYSSDSLCELSRNKTQSEDKKQLLADELSLLDFVTQDIPGEYEERLMKVQKELEDGVTDPENLAMASDLFGEEI